MACLNRPTFATYTIAEKVTIDTTDNEDHTFCGIAFPIQAKRVLPVDHIIINSICVRGKLGPLTVWVTNDDTSEMSDYGTGVSPLPLRYDLRNRGQTLRQSQMVMKAKHFTKIYEKTHSPKSVQEYEELDLSQSPIILRPGQIRGVYIHSSRPDDKAIVYDNQQKLKTYDDQFLSVLPGRSHVSPEAFGSTPIWGWGTAWRDNREFVGKISYGVVYQLWNPNTHLNFGHNFRKTVEAILACQRRWESPFSMLSDDCIYYILNMCRWDWMKDDFKGMRRAKRSLLASIESTDQDEIDTNDMEEGAGTESVEMEETMRINNFEDDEMNEVGDGDDDEYDSDYGDSEDESDEEDDDGYDDHRGSSRFQFIHYDDVCSTDDETEAEANRRREERRRALWLRHHIFHAILDVHPRQLEEDSDEN
jgi:hypothetical protein